MNGGHVLLDSATGRGWRLHRQDLRSAVTRRRCCGFSVVNQLRVGRDVDDSDGYLAAWFDAKQVEAVLVRPDFYVAAAESEAHQLSAQIVRMGPAMDLPAIGDLAQTRRDILS